MAWVRLDDSYGRNPKVLAAGPLCRDLYILALCWCNNQLSDGYIPSSIICTLSPGLRAAGRIASRLVELGLWEQVPGGYQVHDYAEYQPTREEVLSRREAWRIRQWRTRSRRDSRVSPPESHAKTPPVSHGESHGHVTESRPGPSQEYPSVGSPVTSPSPTGAPDGRPGSGNTKNKKARAAEQAEYDAVRRAEWAMLTPEQREARIQMGMVPPTVA